jgi:hypothetical protein
MSTLYSCIRDTGNTYGYWCICQCVLRLWFYSKTWHADQLLKHLSLALKSSYTIYLINMKKCIYPSIVVFVCTCVRGPLKLVGIQTRCLAELYPASVYVNINDRNLIASLSKVNTWSAQFINGTSDDIVGVIMTRCLSRYIRDRLHMYETHTY